MLLHKQVQTPRIIHETLVDYFLSQFLTSIQYIQNIKDIALQKSQVVLKMEDNSKQMKIIKAKKVQEKVSKDLPKKKRTKDKGKKELTFTKWKEGDNGDQRERIL